MKNFVIFCAVVAASTSAVAQPAAKAKSPRAEVQQVASRAADKTALEERMGQRQLDMLIAQIIDEDTPSQRRTLGTATATALASR